MFTVTIFFLLFYAFMLIYKSWLIWTSVKKSECCSYVWILIHICSFMTWKWKSIVMKSKMCFTVVSFYFFIIIFWLYCFIHWMSQLLAEMISEPAFLSEYTVFALDPTKRPKPKSECVVSPHCSIFHSDGLADSRGYYNTRSQK